MRGMLMNDGGVPVVWKFKALLEREQITVYRLHQQIAASRVTKETLYAWSRGTAKQIDLTTADRVLEGLRRLTGKAFSLNDLVEWQPSPANDSGHSGL
jgi:hypothetical protein